MTESWLFKKISSFPNVDAEVCFYFIYFILFFILKSLLQSKMI